MKKRILVTGATGFIGNYTVPELLGRGQEVIASSSHKAKAIGASWFKQVQYIPFDLSDFDNSVDYFELFGRPDLMIHLAWEGLPNYNSSFHLQTNFPRHTAFLKNMVSHGLQDLTVTGTCFEYGMQEGCLSEDMAALPKNPYGLAKDALRRAMEEYQSKHPFIFKWIRLFYMFGQGQNPNSLLSQLDRALDMGEKVFNMSGGQQVRDFLPVETVAQYIATIGLQQTYQGIINCCSGRPVKVEDFVKDYLQLKKAIISLNLGYYPYPSYEPMQFWGDDHKLNKMLAEL
jgi:dTDP-6-deoxy-L-talose 4-dehydrogenase (NAD+)